MNKCTLFSLIVLHTLRQDFEIKTSEIMSFLPLKKNSVTLGLTFLFPYLLSYHQTPITLFISLLDYSLKIFINIVNCL